MQPYTIFLMSKIPPTPHSTTSATKYATNSCHSCGNYNPPLTILSTKPSNTFSLPNSYTKHFSHH